MSVTAVLPLVLVRALVLASLATILVRPIAGVPTTNRALQQPQYAGFDRNDDVDEQRDFLEALYDSTNGGAWIRRNDWKDATVSYCNWEGVSCRGYLGLNNIHELELGSNNLVGMLPNEKIGSLVEIETLDLANNDLTGPLPEELGDLRRLNYMFIEGNEFDTPLPGIVCIKFQPGKYGFEERNEFMNDLEVCTGGFWSSKSSIKVLRIQCIIWISILSIGCLGMFRIQLAQFCGKRTALLQRQIIRHEDPESQSGGLKIQLVWSLLWGVYFFREEQLDIARLILIALLVMIFVFSTKDMYWFKQMVKYVRGGDEDSNRQPTNNQSTTAGEDYNVAEDPSRTVDEDSNVAEDQGTTVGEDSNVAEDQSTTVGEDSNVAEVQSKPSELVRHFPKLSICMLVVQISIAIVGFFVLGFSQSDAYGATLAASGILGWNFSILSWIFTLPSGPKVVEDGGPKITSANAGTSWNPLKRVWSSFGGRSGTAAQTKNLRLPADDPPLKMATVVVPAVVPDVVPDDQRSEQRPPGVVVHAPPFPSNLDHLSNLTQPYRREHEAPYFWDVHFSGETVAEAIFGQCHYLVQACEHGTRQPHFNEDKLEVFYLDGVRYVNVDTTTPDGIDRAGRLGLAKSGDADVIISPNLHLMSTKVFSTVNSGRMFALFRDPVDRAMTMYYYLSKASWDPMYNPKLAKMTIEEYAQSGFIENNWVTRFLVDKPGGKLTKQDMLMAKNIIRYKCLVGLYSDLESSMSRFQRYFGWNAGDTKTRNDDIPKCRKAFIEAGDKRMQHEQLDKRSRAWSLIEKQNKFDMELYEFSKRIFKVQGKQIFNVVG